ncbi:hypothetical protein TL16_g04036 [Triparma laevis f. inornata]|uniref:Ubiquitin-like domain-containing protein n=1 Tax=Triparma laevis f. inornata TaxID=1714386 RepID=A0A9W7E4D2_9STRA|nr:hypothetical protein TL16_g04036 [Triparma laevis f. inornata]
MDWSTGSWWKYNDEVVNFIGSGPKHVVETEADIPIDAGEAASVIEIVIEVRSRCEYDNYASNEEIYTNSPLPSSPRTSSSQDDYDDVSKNKKNKKNEKSKKTKTSAAAKSVGSEDAYMLVYVRKSFLKKESQCATAPELNPPTKTLNKINEDNSKLKDDIEKTKDGISSNSELIASRKAAIANIFGFKADAKPDSRIPQPLPPDDNGHYNLIDTKWLREWITGEEVPWDNVVVKISDKPSPPTKTEGSTQADAIEIDFGDDGDGEGEKEKTPQTPSKQEQEPSTDSTLESQNTLRGAVKIQHKQFLCEHSSEHEKKIKPLDLQRFKVIPANMYAQIIAAVALEMGIEERDVCDWDISFNSQTATSMQCDDCYAQDYQTLMLNRELFDKWRNVSKNLDSVIDKKRKGQEEEGYFVSTAWISAFQKAFKEKSNMVLKNGLASLKAANEILLFDLPKKNAPAMPDGECVMDVESAAPQTPKLAEIFQKQPGASALTYDINSGILCGHGHFIKAHNRNKYKVLPKGVWAAVKGVFTDAIECSSSQEGCDTCVGKKNEEIDKEKRIRAWSTEAKRNRVLKDLLTEDRRKIGFKASMVNLLDSSNPDSFEGLPTPPPRKKHKALTDEDDETVQKTIARVYLVDRKGMEAWRVQVNEITKAGMIAEGAEGVLTHFQDTGNNKCKCGKEMIPERLNMVLFGKKPGLGAYDPYRTGEESEESKGDFKMQQCELVDEEEYQHLQQSLLDHDGLRGLDAASKIVVFNAATLTQNGTDRQWIWDTERCEACMKDFISFMSTTRKFFENKKIRIVTLTTIATVPGLEKPAQQQALSSEDTEEGNDNDNDEFTMDEVKEPAPANEGGVLGGLVAAKDEGVEGGGGGVEKEEATKDFGSPSSTGTRRSKRQSQSGKSEEITVSSSDKLGKLRLQLWELKNISPVGQHLYFNGKELAFDDNDKTLEDLEIAVGSTIYCQMDKRGMTKSEREQFQENEEGLIATLLSFCGSDDGGGANRVERGFGGSWLMGEVGGGGGGERGVLEIGGEVEKENGKGGGDEGNDEVFAMEML